LHAWALQYFCLKYFRCLKSNYCSWGTCVRLM
jgi:hypothetical protein